MGLKELQEINAEGTISTNPADLYIGKGKDLANHDFNQASIQDLVIRANVRTRHLGCIGATQVGKSSLVMLKARQDIKAGLNLIVMNPKGDQDVNACIVQAAAEAGRLGDLMFVDPIFPETSIKIDPLAYWYMEDELVDHITSGIKAKDEYFINVATEISTVIVAGLIMLEKAKGNASVKLNFMDIKNWSSYFSLKQLKENLEYLKNNPDREIRENAGDTINSIEHVLASPQDFFAKVASSLRTTLTALTSGATGKIIGKADTNEFIKRLESGQRVILVANTGSMLTRRTAHTVGRVLISMIQSLIGRFYASKRKLEPALSIYLDEGHNILYRDIEELFNKSGSANVFLQFYTQSLSQMRDAVGDDITESLIDNMHAWIYMRLNNTLTAEFVEMSTPLVKIKQSMNTMSGGGISMMLRDEEQRMVLRQQLQALEPRWFYMKSAEGIFYKGYVDEVKKPYISVVPPRISVF